MHLYSLCDGREGIDMKENGLFFQAADGIRAGRVTGVQTCALPIYAARRSPSRLDPLRPPRTRVCRAVLRDAVVLHRVSPDAARPEFPVRRGPVGLLEPARAVARSEERRVGKEGRARLGAWRRGEGE